MSKITGQEPAMPCIESINHNGEAVEIRTSDAGLTMLQEFSARFMAAYISNETEESHFDSKELMAAASVECAMALIAELNKPQP